MHKMTSASQSSILNALFAEGICDTRVSAYGILCFVPSLLVLRVIGCH